MEFVMILGGSIVLCVTLVGSGLWLDERERKRSILQGKQGRPLVPDPSRGKR